MVVHSSAWGSVACGFVVVVHSWLVEAHMSWRGHRNRMWISIDPRTTLRVAVDGGDDDGDGFVAVAVHRLA